MRQDCGFWNEPCKGETTALFQRFLPPLQGLCIYNRRQPRALPWAFGLQPFRL
jgi:hypothetical protein